MSRPGGWAQHSAFVKKSEPSPRSPQEGARDRETPTEVRRNGLGGPHLVLRTGGTGPRRPDLGRGPPTHVCPTRKTQCAQLASLGDRNPLYSETWHPQYRKGQVNE